MLFSCTGQVQMQQSVHKTAAEASPGTLMYRLEGVSLPKSWARTAGHHPALSPACRPVFGCDQVSDLRLQGHADWAG